MEKFIKFLERNGAWKNFERAFRNYGRDVKWYENLYNKYPKKALTGAFDWSRTEEGISYWNYLNDKWVQENTPLKEELLSND